jgi:hypothetical protein
MASSQPLTRSPVRDPKGGNGVITTRQPEALAATGPSIQATPDPLARSGGWRRRTGAHGLLHARLHLQLELRARALQQCVERRAHLLAVGPLRVQPDERRESQPAARVHKLEAEQLQVDGSERREQHRLRRWLERLERHRLHLPEVLRPKARHGLRRLRQRRNRRALRVYCAASLRFLRDSAGVERGVERAAAAALPPAAAMALVAAPAATVAVRLALESYATAAWQAGRA